MPPRASSVCALAGYAASVPPGVRLPYRQATETLRCVDDPGSSFYNRWVEEGAVAKDWSSSEDMRRKDELYRFAVWVGHNDAPPASGAGSCIFLHVRSSPAAVTAGCTAFEIADLEDLVRWLDPGAAPVLVQLPAARQRELKEAWGLPAPR